MAAFYILAVDDREYKLKLTTASKIEAEKRLGFSLLEAPENITRAETFSGHPLGGPPEISQDDDPAEGL